MELATSAYASENARPNLSDDEPIERLSLVRRLSIVPESDVELPSNVQIQEKDQPILQAAIASKASHLITGDRRDFGRYFGKQVAGIWVMPPRQYLDTKKT